MSEVLSTPERIEGALLGLATGDALGGPVETMTTAEIAALFPDGVTDYPSIEGSPVRPGEVTDDTEMAFFMTASLIEERGLVMDDIVRRLIAWADAAGSRLGPSTSRGVAALRQGADWRTAGGDSDPSSGSLPRTAPLGLLLPPAEIVAATVAACAPTHRHPLAVAAAAAQNLLLAHLLEDRPWAEALAALDGLTLPGADTIRAAIAAGTGPEGAVAVLAEAVRCVTAAADARTALVTAVSAGGDTDTRGAVAGALAGARWGDRALPRAWVQGCHAADEARALAAGLGRLRADRHGRAAPPTR